MNIEKINGLNCKAKVNDKFVSGAEKFYIKRNMPIQYDCFKKTLDKIEFLGDENSEILYKAIPKDNGFHHLLCLKNETINKKQAIIIKASEKYTDILKFFTNINDNMFYEWENNLKP